MTRQDFALDFPSYRRDLDPVPERDQDRTAALVLGRRYIMVGAIVAAAVVVGLALRRVR